MTVATPDTHITPRELAALKLMAAGHTVRSAGQRLGVSHHNVESALVTLRTRWSTGSTLQTVVHAVAVGVLSLEDIRAADRQRQEGAGQ